MASVDWDRYRAVNGGLESRVCYNTNMTQAYDIDKLLAKWELVLQSKCLELLELLRYEISLYYRECAIYGAIKLPLAPIMKFDDIEIIGNNYPIDKQSFELRILKPVKRA